MDVISHSFTHEQVFNCYYTARQISPREQTESRKKNTSTTPWFEHTPFRPFTSTIPLSSSKFTFESIIL
jgi:hypothetical protein